MGDPSLPDQEQAEYAQQVSSSTRRRAYAVGCDVERDVRVFSGITYPLPNQGVKEELCE
jgi:hypothetical protein